MPAPFYYKVKPGDLWSSIASLFKVPQQSIIQANPGVSQLSTGMKIKVPSTNGWIGAGAGAPINPGRNVTGGGIDPWQPIGQPGSITGQTGPTNMGGRNVTGGWWYQDQGSTGTPATPAKPVTPLGMYTQPKTPFSPYRTGADPYATIKYERDPVTGAPRYNYTQVYVNGEYQGEYARSIYVRDVKDEAYKKGVTEQQYVEELTALGYVLFGGTYVYVGDGTSPAAQAAAPVPAFYRVGRGRDKWVTTEQAAVNANRRRGQHYQERMEYRNEQERRKKEGKASEGSLNVNFGVGAG